MARLIGISLIVLCFAIVASADDPGQVDSLILGTVMVEPGTPSVMLPVYAITDDAIVHFILPLQWESSDDQIHISGAYFFNTLLQWDEAIDTVDLDQNHIVIMGTADLGGDPNPPLNTGYQRQLVMMLRIVIRSGAEDQFVPIYTYNDFNWGQPAFYLDTGEDLLPVIVPGAIYLEHVGIDADVDLPGEINLAQNYPNPFNAETRISFDLPNSSDISLDVYDVLGRRIRTLTSGKREAGHYSITWNGKDDSGNNVTSGMYFYRLRTAESDLTGKMVLLK
jgi:hypothetical protein